MKYSIALITIATAMCVGSWSDAKTISLGPQDNWFAVLSGPSLEPGDEIVLSSGVYSSPRRLHIRQRGTSEKPIVIRAADNARVTFRRPDAKQNSFNVSGEFLTIRGIEITGGATGIRIGKDGDRMARFITLENLHIHHVGGVAVTANYPGEIYEGLVFRGNHIHHTSGHGEAFYLGANNQSDGSTNGYMFDSLIEKNHIHHLTGASVSQGDGIELKDGCYNNIVRDNIIHDTNYPGIIQYSADGKSPNIIERNAIWNTGDHGIQAAADAIIRNNVIFETKGDGIHCRDHQSAVVGNLKILHNTILSESSLRVVASKSWSGPVVIANNAFHAKPRIEKSKGITTLGNVAGLQSQFPITSTSWIGAGVAEYRVKVDFNGAIRGESIDAGAYVSKDGLGGSDRVISEPKAR